MSGKQWRLVVGGWVMYLTGLINAQLSFLAGIIPLFIAAVIYLALTDREDA